MLAKREQILAGILVAIAALGGYVWLRPMNGTLGAAGNPRTPGRAAAGATSAVESPEVRLESLSAERPGPGEIERNLFRFKPRPAPVAAAHAPVYAAPQPPPGPPPPPPVPPIGLKFIGVLERSTAVRIAILSDGRGAPIYGKEGEAVLGQYRILRINSESVEMAYLDGRGRQTIRLSGS